ncbi:hypothetical protein D3C73_1103400 [compost metagenome]
MVRQIIVCCLSDALHVRIIQLLGFTGIFRLQHLRKYCNRNLAAWNEKITYIMTDISKLTGLMGNRLAFKHGAKFAINLLRFHPLHNLIAGF